MSAAFFSKDRKHRFRLERNVQRHGSVGFICMVNPSVADEQRNDQTIRKIIGFGQRLGIREWIVGNLFSRIATDVADLHPESASHPYNLSYVKGMMRDAEVHYVAWGSMNKLHQTLRTEWVNVASIARMIDVPLYCLGTCADGHPKHPLRLPYDTKPKIWRAPWPQNEKNLNLPQPDKDASAKRKTKSLSSS